MPVCARAVQQADGSMALVLDTTQTNVSACTYVVQTGPEVASSLVALSIEDGGLISSAIVGCWAAAYGIRQLVNFVQTGSNEA